MKETIEQKLKQLGAQQQQSMKDILSLESNLESRKAELSRIHGRIDAYGDLLNSIAKEENTDGET